MMMLKNRKTENNKESYDEIESGLTFQDVLEQTENEKPSRKTGFLNRIWNMMDRRIKK